MTKETTALLEDFSGEKSLSNRCLPDDQYIEFYENNQDMLHFDPPLTLEVFGALLEKSLQ